VGRGQMKKITVAEVYLWGTLVGHVSWNEKTDVGAFEYDAKFLKAPVEPSPIKMPKKKTIYSFRDIDRKTFKGLPGMLSDSLPDKYGNALIDVWLSTKGRTAESFNPVERLCYMGSRGMGALEFKPSSFKKSENKKPIEISEMVNLASDILSDRESFKEHLSHGDNRKLKESLANLLVIGTSAGGARAKCVIAFNEETKEVRSGQVKTSKDFSYWLMKLDGVSNNRDKELNDPKGYGRIEYAYSLMAKECGIEMTECRLLEENERAHFMTKRFDRGNGGEKLHMQTLCALAHYDFNMPGAYSYEQALEAIRQVVSVSLSHALEQQFRRTVFNVIGRNQDDHTKNISFLMNKNGDWSLSPAYDITYSYNPSGAYTSKHQMSINGKTDGLLLDDLIVFGSKADLKKAKVKEIVEEIKNVFRLWNVYAQQSGVSDAHKEKVSKGLRLDL
jgi:serine/threonine-protein kinase HipA